MLSGKSIPLKLSEIKRILSEEDIRLTKALGQNFLHDRNQLKRIVALADIHKDDSILEIGPGLGPLTELLLAAGNKVTAVEADARLVEKLRARFGAVPEFALEHADALQWLKSNPPDFRAWKMVSNLPYSVASPILAEFSLSPKGPRTIVCTLQWEVAQKILAPHGNKTYGVLSLLVQLNYEPGSWFKIPNACFFPEPGVESACLRLNRRSQPLLPFELQSVFVKIVKRGFSQRRKMMIKLLKQDWPKEALERALHEIGLSEKTRAEAVSLDQFVRLTLDLSGRNPQGEEMFDVVNENDETIDRRPRSVVHEKNLLHRAVHVFVFNSAGELFLQKRSMKKDCFPGCWDSSASGHVDSGETYDHCAMREVKEELGINLPQPPEKLFKVAASPETGHEFFWLYRTASDAEFSLHPEEIDDGRWIAPAEIDRWIDERPDQLASCFRIAWREYRKFEKQNRL